MESADVLRQQLLARRLALSRLPEGPRRELARRRLAGAAAPFPASSSPIERRTASGVLTPRWYPLNPHEEQHRLVQSRARYRVVPAGRRSGKTEIAKRFVVGTAMCAHHEARFFVGAPTWQQAKRIWWKDIKALSPPHLVADKSDGELWIRYINGAEIWVVGTDVAARIEGTPWDGGILDEYANMRKEVWEDHLFPVMTERGGWCWFIGVPEGRNHYYRLYRQAQAQAQARSYILAGRADEAAAILHSAFGDEADSLISAGLGALEWDAFSWVSADILSPAEIAAAKRTMSADVFEREFEARFTAFRGRVYKPFRTETHCAPLAHKYNPQAPLIFMLDFNVAPGAAVVAQETELPSGHVGTAIMGEVHVPYDSTTETVCRKLCDDWEGHGGPVVLYGDSTGGQRRTQAAEQGGTDWKIVHQVLRKAFPRIIDRVPSANPPERDRVNNLNARIRSAADEIRLMVDPIRAPKTVEDLEGVRWKEGTNEIAKSGKENEGLTHWTDGVGYYVSERWPIPDYSASGIKRRRYAVT